MEGRTREKLHMSEGNMSVNSECETEDTNCDETDETENGNGIRQKLHMSEGNTSVSSECETEDANCDDTDETDNRNGKQ
jgi:hypothetical protein